MLNIRWFWINSFKEQIFFAGKWYSTFLFGVFKFPTAQKAIAPLKCKLVLHIHNVFSRINSLPVSQSSRPRPFTFHAFSMLKNSQQQTLFPSHWQWRNFCRHHRCSTHCPLHPLSAGAFSSSSLTRLLGCCESSKVFIRLPSATISASHTHIMFCCLKSVSTSGLLFPAITLPSLVGL